MKLNHSIKFIIFDLPMNKFPSSFPIRHFQISHLKICVKAEVIAFRNSLLKYNQTYVIKTTISAALWQTARVQKCTCYSRTPTIHDLQISTFSFFPTSDIIYKKLNQKSEITVQSPKLNFFIPHCQKSPSFNSNRI